MRAFRIAGALVLPLLAGPARADTVTEESGGVAPQQQRVRKDPSLFAAGLTTAIVGGVGLQVGATLVALSDKSCWIMCGEKSTHEIDRPLQTAGFVTTPASLAAVAVGIPLAVVGGKKVPREAALVPLVAPGLAGGTLGVVF
jgi:hypothetical protein